MQSTSGVSWRMSIPLLHRLLLFLAASVVIAGFIAAALAPPQGPADTLPRLFSLFLMDLEKNIPTYLSVGLLVLGSLAFLLTGALRPPPHGTPEKSGVFCVSGVANIARNLDMWSKVE